MPVLMFNDNNLPHPGLDSAAVPGQDDDRGPGGAPGGVGEDVSPGVGPHDGAGVQVIRPQLGEEDCQTRDINSKSKLSCRNDPYP